MDLITGVNWECSRTSKLIAGIVSQLAAYTEEGVPMTPSVFICNSISELIQRAGVGEHVPLSGDIPTESAGPKILKAAAPLCSTNWRIYIERSQNGESCRFGVFCGSNDPSSLTIDEVILDEFSEGFPIIRISQNATNKVEVRSNAGDGIEFRFNDDVDVTELNSREHIFNLSKSIAANSGALDTFIGFTERILTTAISNCHGTLIAVVPSSKSSLPTALQDLVSLDSPIHLYERFKRHMNEGKTASSVSRLQAASELVTGFISSDGITVFNDAGVVLGYRGFIQNTGDGTPTNGGARSRAFSAMKKLVGSELTAAFFRSQDGRTDFVQALIGVTNE